MSILGFSDMEDIIVRCLLSITILFIMTRLMGKKQIAQLNFFDYIVGITIGSIAAAFAVDDTISYAHGIIGLISYGLVPLLVSYISMHSLKGRKFLGDTPTILIQNGKLIEKNLKKSKFHINDVLEECRLKGAFSMQDVEFAILETSGKVSIQLKADKQPITAGDMKIKKSYTGLTADVIIDGKIMPEHLRLINKDEKWLYNELKKQKVSSPKKVLLATVDASGKIFVDLKNSDPLPLDVME